MVKRSRIKEKISDSLELPRDVILNVPTIKITGNNEIYIENHRGIVEYSCEILRINSEIGLIKILGKNIYIKEINKEEIFIIGDISTIEFIS